MGSWDTLIPFFFWALLVLPGHALARRLAPGELASGPIAGIAVCALCLLVCLLPVVAFGYLIGMPIWVLSAVLLAGIVWGGWDTWRSGSWKSFAGIFTGVLGIEVLALLIDVIMSERVGSILAADARVHVARIRFLMGAGLTNQDPYVVDSAFYPIYHTNLHHALMAAASRLLGLDPLVVWYGSLGMAKVLVASGLAYLTWSILPSRWAVAVAVLFVVMARGPITFSTYPNQLAPWFLLPVLLGVCMRTTSSQVSTITDSDVSGKARRTCPVEDPESGWSPTRSLLTVMAVALVVGSFHGLYAGFGVVLGAPLLLTMSGWRLLRKGRRAGARAPLAALVGLLVGCAIYPGVTHFTQVKPGPRQIAAQAERFEQAIARKAEAQGVTLDQLRAPDSAVELAEEPLDEPFTGAPEVMPEVAVDYEAAAAEEAEPIVLDATRKQDIIMQIRTSMLPKVDGFTRADAMIWRSAGRGQSGAWRTSWGLAIPYWRYLLAGLGVIVSLVMLRRTAPLELLVAFAVVQTVMMVPQLCTTAYRFLGEFWMVLRFETMGEVLWIALAIPPIAMLLERVVRNRLLQCLLTLALLPIGYRHAYFKSPYSWDFYENRAMQKERIRHRRALLPLLNLGNRLELALPPDAIVATHPYNADYLAMIVDCSFVAPERSSSGIPKLGVRKGLLREMLSFQTEEERRAELFDQFGVTHVVMSDRISDWIPFWTSEVGRVGRWKIATIWDKPDFTLAIFKDMRRGIKAMRRDDFPNAILAFERVVDEDPGRADIWFRLGNARLWTGDSGGAIEAYEAAIGLEPDDANALIMLGNAYQQQDMPDAADAIYNKTIETAVESGDLPMAASAAYNLGNISYRAMDWAEAVRLYEMAIEFDSYHVNAPIYLEEARSRLASSGEESADEG